MNSEQLVTERGKTHGKFSDNAFCAQDLKRTIREHLHLRATRGQPSLSDQQIESLDLMATKIARIITGDSSLLEHWDDIAGYATIANKQF